MGRPLKPAQLREMPETVDKHWSLCTAGLWRKLQCYDSLQQWPHSLLKTKWNLQELMTFSVSTRTTVKLTSSLLTVVTRQRCRVPCSISNWCKGKSRRLHSSLHKLDQSADPSPRIACHNACKDLAT